MGAACCRPAAADDGHDSGGAIKKHARGNGAVGAARRGSRSRDAAAAALTSHAISTSPSSFSTLAKADSVSSSGLLAVVSEDDECFFDARSDDGCGSSVGSLEGVGPSLSLGRRAGSGGAGAAHESAPGFFAGVAAAVAARLGFRDAAASSTPTSPASPPPAAATSMFSFPWFSLRRSASSSHSTPPGDKDADNNASPFAAAASAATTPRAGGGGRGSERDRDRFGQSQQQHRRSLSLNPRPVAGPGGQPSMELAPGVVVPADVVLQPEPPAGAGSGSAGSGGGVHGDGVVVPGACMPLLSLARESLGARGLGHLASLRRQQQQHRATFVQTVRPNAGDSGLQRAPEYESGEESEGDEKEGGGERGGETGNEAASSSAAAPSSSEAAKAAAGAGGGEKQPWHRRFDWNRTASSQQRRQQRGGGGEGAERTPAPPAPPLPLLTETYGPCDATTFRVRSRDYLRTKVKQASPPAIYELVAADLYSFDFKISHIAKHVVLPPLPAPSAAHAALPPHDRLPPLLVLNIQLPTYPASIWGGSGGGGGGGGGMLGGLFGGGGASGGDGNSATAPPSSSADGRGHSLVFYFRLPDHWDPELYERSHAAAAPALGLFRRLVHNGREPSDGAPTRERLKLIARVANPAEWATAAPLSSAEARLLASYNDKPLLTRPQHKFFHGPGYMEIDLDVHAYAFLARRALTAFLSRLSTVVFDNALVVEGRSGTELPEAVLCCARVARVDFEVARPFPATADPEEAIAAAAAFAAEEAAKLKQKEAEKEGAAGAAAAGNSSSSAADDARGPPAPAPPAPAPPLGSTPWRPSTEREGSALPLESAMSSSISVALSGVAPPGTPGAAAASAAAASALNK